MYIEREAIKCTITYEMWKGYKVGEGFEASFEVKKPYPMKYWSPHLISDPNKVGTFPHRTI